MNRYTYAMNFGIIPSASLCVQQGENQATTLRVKVDAILARWPDATFAATIKRPDGAVYVGDAGLVADESKSITYLLTSTDTEMYGELRMQINAMDGDVIVKTCVYGITVKKSLGETGPAPSPGDNLLDKISEVVAEGKQARDEAQEAAAQAVNAVGSIAQLKVDAHEAQGDVPTATVSAVDDHLEISFGLVRGPEGPQGAPGEKGNPGAVQSVDGVEPDTHGNVPLGLADKAACRIGSTARGNPLTIHPAAGSHVQITSDKDCTLTYPGGTLALVAGEAVEIKADRGDMTLSADNGAVLTISYNRDSMSVLEEVLPEVSASGAVTQLSGLVSGMPLDVSMEMLATQEGSGDPSPDNVRPIVGKDTLNAWFGGKNLWNIPSFNKIGYAIDLSTVSPDVNAHVLSVINSIPRGVSLVQKFMYQGDGNQISGVSGVRISFIRDDGTIFPTTSGVPLVLTKNVNRVLIYGNQNGTYGNFSEFQLELGQTATPYAPYLGYTIPIALPETAYGLPGAPDVVRIDRDGGVWFRNTSPCASLAVDDVASAEVYADVVRVSYPKYWSIGKIGASAVCSHLPYTTGSVSLTTEGINTTSGSPRLWLSFAHETLGTTSSTPSSSALASVRAYINAQAAAGTPLQVMYQLATTVTTKIGQITPLGALGGTNASYGDGGGSTTIKGYLSGQGMLDMVTSANTALQAQITALQNAATAG